MKHWSTVFAALALSACTAPAQQQPGQQAPEAAILVMAVPPEPTPPAPAAAARSCPPLPELHAGASTLERRVHTQTIVRMYAECAQLGTKESP